MKTALLLIDIQNDYFEKGNNPLDGSLKASQNAKKLLDFFRDKKEPVIHIQHISTSKTATFFLPETKGAEFHENVRPHYSEIIVVKHYPNSFQKTELLSILEDKKVENLVVCGMMTHMCVDATVRAAKDLGFAVTLITDACATKKLTINDFTVSAENVQLSFLAALNTTYATLKTTEDFLKCIASAY